MGQLSRSSIANIERGKQGVSLLQLYVLAEALEVTPADLLPPPAAVLQQGRSIDHKLSEHTKRDRDWLQRIRGSLPSDAGGKDA
jgi:transcriptional regulator with XRE-family HTH domain